MPGTAFPPSRAVLYIRMAESSMPPPRPLKEERQFETSATLCCAVFSAGCLGEISEREILKNADGSTQDDMWGSTCRFLDFCISA